MKIFNIRNTKEFFTKLSECSGQVDILWIDGVITEVKPGRMSSADIKWDYLDGTLKQIELKFHEPEDLAKMLRYIVNRRSYGTYSLKLNELKQAG